MFGRWQKKDFVDKDGGRYFVSTVKLPADMICESHPFETMIFPMDPDGTIVFHELFCDRYGSQAEAEMGHERVLAGWNPTTRSID
jgi:hypothetical protein